MFVTPIGDSISDPTVAQAIERAMADDASQGSWDPDPRAHREHGYPISSERGELVYLLARASRATRVVEFATSIGISTMYLAAAVRDNGGGVVVGAEIIPDKVQRARANIDAAGLTALVDIREGDAFDTLVDVGPIDLVLLDGWPTGEVPSVDRRMLDVLVPQMRAGAVLFDDNGQRDVTEYLADPANGFRPLAVLLPDGPAPVWIHL